jgi:hypothetical protein
MKNQNVKPVRKKSELGVEKLQIIMVYMQKNAIG